MSRCGDPDKLFVYGNLDANGERWVAHPVYREDDVYNFDETACRFHEDATGKLIALKGLLEHQLTPELDVLSVSDNAIQVMNLMDSLL